MTTDRNIVITGFMGTGKTTVGEIVGHLIGRPFIDADAEIVRRNGMTIPEMFARYGEKQFRYIEGRMCRFLASQRDLVISTGGGMLVNETNREVMISSGFVVCLNASIETLRRRLYGADDRPLLKMEDLELLLDRRREAYAAIPNQVDTTDKTPEQVAQEIITLWSSFK